MKMRTLILSLALSALVAMPALAVRKNYQVTAKQEVHTPVGTIIRPPGSWEGPRMRASFSDNGGKIRMEKLQIDNKYENQFDASGTTGTPNCFARTVIRSNFAPGGLPVDETGTNTLAAGGVATFGTLGGWARAGEIWCFAALYSGTTYIVVAGVPVAIPVPPVIGTGPTYCAGCDTSAGLVHDGWGSGPPMYSTSYNLDPFTFPAGGASFTAGGSIQTFSTNGGYVNGYITTISGAETVAGAPMLLPAGVAALGASLTFLGARSLRRRNA